MGSPLISVPVRLQCAGVLHRLRAQLGAVEGPLIDALQLASILKAERREVSTIRESVPSDVRDASRNNDAPDIGAIEAAVLDATQQRAGLEDDLAKLSAVSEGKLPDDPDAAGDHHSADVASPEPAVANDLETIWETNGTVLADTELFRCLRCVL